jgi:hypothetical protein
LHGELVDARQVEPMPTDFDVVVAERLSGDRLLITAVKPESEFLKDLSSA